MVDSLTSRFSQSPDLIGTATQIRITPPEEVREKFRRIKPFKELSITQRGWTLDVLNIVRRISDDRRRRREETLTKREDHGERPTHGISQRLLTSSSAEVTFTNADVYAHERELAQLHPDNRHVKDKIRQQLQVLRDLGILSQPGWGEWTFKK